MAAESMTFGPLRVTFDERVLRPRRWTLGQARWAADLATDLADGPILELCSGAGHIGQAAAALSGRSLVQVDVDPHACALAEANAAANGLGATTTVICADLSTWTPAVATTSRFPLVLADPPYLPSGEVPAWPDDPSLAIDGGDDGLDLPRRCLAAAARHLAPAGAVLLQARGAAQVAALATGVAAAGLEVVEVRREDDERAVALLR